MIYPYRCQCGHEFEIIKSVKLIDRIETCPSCGHNCTKENRYLGRGHFYGAAVEDAEWNPAFGKVIKNSKHRREEAKRLGMEEVGNENPHKAAEKTRKQLDKERHDSWDKIECRI